MNPGPSDPNPIAFSYTTLTLGLDFDIIVQMILAAPFSNLV